MDEAKGMVKAMKRLRKAFILACAFISTFMIASTAVYADLIYEAPNNTVGLDVIIDPVEVAEYAFIQILPYVIIVIVLIITALLVALFLNKKKHSNTQDGEIKDDEIKNSDIKNSDIKNSDTKDTDIKNNGNENT